MSDLIEHDQRQRAVVLSDKRIIAVKGPVRLAGGRYMAKSDKIHPLVHLARKRVLTHQQVLAVGGNPLDINDSFFVVTKNLYLYYRSKKTSKSRILQGRFKIEVGPFIYEKFSKKWGREITITKLNKLSQNEDGYWLAHPHISVCRLYKKTPSYDFWSEECCLGIDEMVLNMINNNPDDALGIVSLLIQTLETYDDDDMFFEDDDEVENVFETYTDTLGKWKKNPLYEAPKRKKAQKLPKGKKRK